jgi:hypothetical protein
MCGAAEHLPQGCAEDGWHACPGQTLEGWQHWGREEQSGHLYMPTQQRYQYTV